MKKSVWVVIIVGILLAGCSSAVSGEQSGLRQITLPVGFIPNIQFAPLYVAIEKGFFIDEGLDVSVDYNMEIDSVALLGAEELEFAIVSGEQVLLGRAQGLPVVYVTAWYQKFPVGVAAFTESDIKEPGDLIGKKVGIPGLYGASYIGFRALLQAGDVAESELTLDSIGFTQAEALIDGLEDAVVIYISNEPLRLKAEEYEVNVIKVSDYLDLVANGLITSEKMVKDNPEVVRGMAAALLKGIEYTSQEPGEAFEISKKYVEGLDAMSESDQEVQKQVLAESIKMWQAEKGGVSDQQAWQNMQNVLLEMGLLQAELDITAAFTNEFLP